MVGLDSKVRRYSVQGGRRWKTIVTLLHKSLFATLHKQSVRGLEYFKGTIILRVLDRLWANYQSNA